MTKCLVFLISALLCLKATAKLPLVEKGKPLPSDIFVELNKVVNPTVVNISTKTTPKFSGLGGSGDPMEEFLKQFLGFGYGMQPNPRPAHSLGTGFIIRKDGLILTNSHVIDKADVIEVQISENDKKTYQAKVIGQDPATDIALIKINAPSSLPVAKLGNSATLEKGEWVAAFGNPLGHGHTMTKGIVSAIGRGLEEINILPFIQTDASINPGNSGGPLVNLKGEVIGVNTAIDGRARGGIGFAIPINEVKKLLPQLEKKGRVSRGFLGVEMQSMNEELADYLKTKQKTGALVINVVPGSAASRAGLKPYDIVISFNGAPISSAGDLSKQVRLTGVGKRVPIKVIRNGKVKKLKAVLKANDDFSKGQGFSLPSPNSPNSPTLKLYGLELENIQSRHTKRFELPNTGKHRTVITRVLVNSPGARAALRPGDVIYEINRKPVFSNEKAKSLLKANKGKTLLLRVRRGDSFFITQLKSK